MNNGADVLLHLSLIEGVGTQTLRVITSLIKNESDLKTIYEWDSIVWQRLGFSEKKAKTIVSGLRKKDLLEDEKNNAVALNARYISLYDSNFPRHLIQSSHGPVILSVWDNKENSTWNRCNKYLACIGSRQATGYSKRVLEILYKEIANENICIVSGGARGGDTFSHLAALKYKLCTIAVLGSGIGKPYPKENRGLFESIVEAGGAILSPFTINTDPSPGTFPVRNHIIAGMSDATLVLQAAEKSGTLITAYSALEQGKEVGTVPGAIDDILSTGCHKLLSQGAHVISNGQELQMLLGLTVKKISTEIIEQKDSLLELLAEPLSAHEIADHLHISLEETYKMLFEYLSQEKIEQDMLGMWIKK